MILCNIPNCVQTTVDNYLRWINFLSKLTNWGQFDTDFHSRVGRGQVRPWYPTLIYVRLLITNKCNQLQTSHSDSFKFPRDSKSIFSVNFFSTSNLQYSYRPVFVKQTNQRGRIRRTSLNKQSNTCLVTESFWCYVIIRKCLRYA